MVKILVLLFGVAMFFGGFWRATENKKRPDVAPIAEDLPPEPEILPIEQEVEPEEIIVPTPSVVEKRAQAHTVAKAASKTRTKSKRSNQGKKVA